MLMHAALRCPEDTFSTDIWPMVMDYAIWIYNRTPDMQSGYVRINDQADINATETVKAKLTFEWEYQSKVVAIKGYHTDNGILNASEFMEDLLKKQKKIRFSGAGASHQNWAAELAIKMVVTMERIMLMHAALICPEDTLFTYIWPMAMNYSVWVYNRIPIQNNSLPLAKYK